MVRVGIVLKQQQFKSERSQQKQYFMNVSFYHCLGFGSNHYELGLCAETVRSLDDPFWQAGPSEQKGRAGHKLAGRVFPSITMSM